MYSVRTSQRIAPTGTRLGLIATTFPLLTLEELSNEGPFEAVCSEYASRGYAGLDISLVHILCIGKDRFARVMQENQLYFIGKCYSSGGGCPSAPGNSAALKKAERTHPPIGRDVESHIAVFCAQMRELCESLPLRSLLLSISGQSGRDYFSQEQADKFFSTCNALGEELGVTVQHETHRHRILFNPWCTRAIVERHPTLNLLADLSHYCVVCETPCEDADLQEAVATLIPRVTHTHARVGYEEGPQVPDPALPAFAQHVAGHVAWWKAIFRAHISRGKAVCTVTPEFLPFPYGPVGCLREGTQKCNDFIEKVVRTAWEEVLEDSVE